MPVVKIRPVAAHDVAMVGARMRQADREEVRASHGLGPIAALREAVAATSAAWCGTVDGAPAAVFGCAHDPAHGFGVPWMLGTDQATANRRAFLCGSRAWVRAALADHGRLCNFVDARNLASIRFLRWLGFTVHDPIVWGVAGLPFHPFEMRAFARGPFEMRASARGPFEMRA